MLEIHLRHLQYSAKCRYNFERLGLEAKPGETEEDEKVGTFFCQVFNHWQEACKEI